MDSWSYKKVVRTESGIERMIGMLIIKFIRKVVIGLIFVIIKESGKTKEFMNLFQ